MIGLHKNSTGYAAAYGLLERLEKEKKVVIERNGATMRVVARAPQDDLIVAEAQKVEQVTETAEAAVTAEVAPELVVTPAEETRLGRVNLALWALQAAANPAGYINGATAPIIASQLGVSPGVAAGLNALLAELGLREMSGPRRALVQRIAKDEKEVTIERLRAVEVARVARRRDRSQQQSDVRAIEPTGLSVSSETSEPSTVVRQPLLEQLADVVEKLRIQVKNLDETNKSLNARLQKGSTEAQSIIGRLNAELDAVRATNEELTEQLKLVGFPSKRVEMILAEYTEENTNE